MKTNTVVGFVMDRAASRIGALFSCCPFLGAPLFGKNTENAAIAKEAGHAELVLPLPPRLVLPLPAGEGRGEGNRRHLALSRGTLAGLLLGAFIGLVLAPILPPIHKAQAATSTAGSTAGVFDVSDSGAATYSIPIAVPPGVRGMQPSLALTYNSQNKENGLLGLGWSLAGLSVIHRCGATIALDGFKGGVNYDANDKFCLDGEHLIAIGNNEYRTEHESWQKVLASDGSPNPSYFTVFSPDGGTRIYGGSGDSRIEAQGHAQGSGIARVWALNRVQDKRANALNVTYTEDNSNGDYRPLEISYVGGTVKVTFGYENRTDIMPHYEGGALMRVTQRLAIVTATTDATTSNPANAKQFVLTYDNGASVGKSRLMSVKECGFDPAAPTAPVCLSPTTFAWQTTAGGTTHKTWSGHGISDSGPHFVDLNGDGRTDYTTSNTAGTHYISLSTGVGYTNTTWSGHGISNGGADYADINGDGRQDYISVSNAGQHYISLSSGSGFTNHVRSGHGISTSGTNFFDVNGDGRSDYITGGTPNIFTPITDYISSSGDAGYQNEMRAYGCGSKNLHDVNGDGRDDCTSVYYNSSSKRVQSHEWFLSTLSGWTRVSVPITEIVSSAGFMVGDFNSDGIKDPLLASASFTSAARALYLSTGKSLARVPDASFSTSSLSPFIADMNGDGIQEYVDVANGSYVVRFFNGTSFVSQQWNTSGLGDYGILGIHFVDLNGDGCDDYVSVSNSGGHYVSLTTCVPDLITSFTNGQSAKAEVTYKPLTDSSVYTKYTDAVYPQKDVQDATYVVSTHQQSNGIGGMNTWTYDYAGLKYDHQAARSLGFYYMNTTGPDSIRQQTYFYQTRELAGQVGSTYTYVSGIERKRETFARDFVALGSGRVLPRLTQTYSTGSDLNNASFGWTQTDYPIADFDAYGFPKRMVTTTSDGHTTTTNTSYVPVDTNWIIGLPASKSVTTTWAGVTSSPRTVNYGYGAGGATCASGVHTNPLPGELTSETVQQGGTADLVLTTNYGYDVNGNRCATSVTGWNGTATVTRTTTSAFGWSGRFPGWTQNTLGHTVYMDNYDTRFGAPTAGRDVNGLQTTAIYDGFGRKTSETQFANTVYPITTTIDYGSWNATGGLGTSVTTTAPGSGTATVYNDLLGRPIQSQTPGLWGAVVKKEVQYDNLGRKIKESLPNYSGQTTYWMTYTYGDALGRLTSTARPLDAQGQPCVSSTTYNGLTVTATNCKNQSVASTKNVVGWTMNTSDGGGTVTNAYDPLGNLKSVTDPVGNVSTMGYDIRGRKTSMSDPDMGSWTYAYNAFGELIRQTDAKAQVTTMTYDTLGRMKTRVRPEGTTTWNYDIGIMAVGKFTSVSAPGYAESQYYDLGRGMPTTNSRTISGASYSTTTQYDSLARPTYLIYPTGFKIENRYDGFGHLAEVWSNSLTTNVRYWKANSADATGAIIEETLGNGLTNKFDYDPGTGRLKTMDTKNGAGAALRDLSFQWDTVGNLTERKWYDGTTNRTENFGYDADGRGLNRLTSVTGPVNKSYAYNAIGNLTTKSDVGNYSYAGCGNRPHAVCSTSGGPVTTTFTYDANGNMLTGNGKTASWTSFNKIWAVSANSFSAFSYGADDQRISKFTNTGTTYYVGKLYEKTTSGTTTTNRHYIMAGSNLVAVYNTGTAAAFTNYYHQDHLGSVDAISSEAGSITARLSYDAWGKRRNPNGTDTSTPITSTRGFTKHEHDDEVGLINMNAREYDPVIGRFISADTIIGNNVPSQALNRYDYANNNPLSLIDPSGHLSKKWKKRLRRIFKATHMGHLVLHERYVINPTFRKIAQHENLAFVVKSFGTIAVGVASGGNAYAIAGFNAAFDAKLAEAYGADFNDQLRIGARSFAAGYVTANFGGNFAAGNAPWYEAAVVNGIGNGIAGGVASRIQGGSFGEGFRASAALSATSTLALEMREAMIRQSMINPDNAGGESAGFLGDRFKLGGCRALGADSPCRGGHLGGIQGGEGTFFGRSYAAGSSRDVLVEAYSGPHDFLNSFMYDGATGNLRPFYGSGAGHWLGEVASYMNVAPASAFVAASVVQTFAPTVATDLAVR